MKWLVPVLALGLTMTLIAAARAAAADAHRVRVASPAPEETPPPFSPAPPAPSARAPLIEPAAPAAPNAEPIMFISAPAALPPVRVGGGGVYAPETFSEAATVSSHARPYTPEIAGSAAAPPWSDTQEIFSLPGAVALFADSGETAVTATAIPSAVSDASRDGARAAAVELFEEIPSAPSAPPTPADPPALVAPLLDAPVAAGGPGPVAPGDFGGMGFKAAAPPLEDMAAPIRVTVISPPPATVSAVPSVDEATRQVLADAIRQAREVSDMTSNLISDLPRPSAISAAAAPAAAARTPAESRRLASADPMSGALPTVLARAAESDAPPPALPDSVAPPVPADVPALRPEYRAQVDEEMAALREELVNQELLRRELERRSLRVDEAELDARLHERVARWIAGGAWPADVDALVWARAGMSEAAYRRRVLWPELALRRLAAADPGPSEAELRRFFTDHRALFASPERVRFAQIMISPRALADARAPRARVAAAEDWLRAERLAAEVHNLLRAGADFAEVARARSHDARTAPHGGELGWAARGELSRVLENGLFALAPGEFSFPLRTAMGYHVVKVLERRSASAPTFEEAADHVRAVWVERTFLDRSTARIERLRAAALEANDWPVIDLARLGGDPTEKSPHER